MIPLLIETGVATYSLIPLEQNHSATLVSCGKIIASMVKFHCGNNVRYDIKNQWLFCIDKSLLIEQNNCDCTRDKGVPLFAIRGD